MSDPKADEFDKDYWFEMYQGQCATTDEWAKKYRDEVERKADATLLARCAELQRIAEVANAMVGKERDQVEAQAKRIAELEAECKRLRVNANIGSVVWKYIDRMGDVVPSDPAARILCEFYHAVLPVIGAAKESA